MHLLKRESLVIIFEHRTYFRKAGILLESAISVHNFRASEFMHIRMEEPYAAPVMAPIQGHQVS